MSRFKLGWDGVSYDDPEYEHPTDWARENMEQICENCKYLDDCIDELGFDPSERNGATCNNFDFSESAIDKYLEQAMEPQ